MTARRPALAMLLCVLLGMLAGTSLGGVCYNASYLTSASVTITDGPGPYIENRLCEYTLSAPPGMFGVLEFSEASFECGWDTISVQDGATRNAPLLAAISSLTLDSADTVLAIASQIPILRSSGASLFVSFTSDPFIVAGGFTARFSAVPCPGNCTERGTCVNGTCQCQAPYTGVMCELQPDTPTRARCPLDANVCVCSAGFRSTSYDEWIRLGPPAVISLVTKQSVCALNSVLSEPECYVGCLDRPSLIEGGDPSAFSAAVFERKLCPSSCQPPCVNGTCVQQYGYCLCDPGFAGQTCSIPISPSGTPSSSGWSDSPNNSSEGNAFSSPFLLVLLIMIIILAIVVTLACRTRVRMPPPLPAPVRTILRHVPLFVVKLAEPADSEPPFPLVFESDTGAVELMLVVIDMPCAAQDDKSRNAPARFALGAVCSSLSGALATGAEPVGSGTAGLTDIRPTPVGPPASASASAAAAVRVPSLSAAAQVPSTVAAAASLAEPVWRSGDGWQEVADVPLGPLHQPGPPPLKARRASLLFSPTVQVLRDDVQDTLHANDELRRDDDANDANDDSDGN